MMVRFDNAPRGIPAGMSQQDYWSRKQYYAINCQVIADDRKIIYDVDCDWHGGVHDARMWRNSTAKQFVEQQRKYMMAGDSAYPISPVLMKPFSNQEAAANASKRLFNRRLCGLRTVMSENVYGIWKQRFPCLRHMRAHVRLAKKMIIATAILHNISILWGDDDPPPADDDEEEDSSDDDGSDDLVLTEHNVRPNSVRALGQLVREELRRQMPPRQRRGHP
jgi:hypothetical protein